MRFRSQLRWIGTIVPLLVLVGLGFSQVNSLAGSADVHWSFEDFTAAPGAVRWVYVTPLSTPRINGSSLAVNDRKTYTSDRTGGLIVSNILTPSNYRIEFVGPNVTTTVTNSFPDTNGYVEATWFVGVSTNVPGSLVGYSQAAADALFWAKSGLLAGNYVTFRTNAGVVYIDGAAGGSATNSIAVKAGSGVSAATNGLEVTISEGYASLPVFDITKAPFSAAATNADNHDAIQLALDSCTNGGGVVYVPKGAFNCLSKLRWPYAQMDQSEFHMPTNVVVLRGDGKNSIIQNLTGTASLIEFDVSAADRNMSQARIEHIALKQNAGASVATNCSPIFYIHSTTAGLSDNVAGGWVTFEDVEFSGGWDQLVVSNVTLVYATFNNCNWGYYWHRGCYFAHVDSPSFRGCGWNSWKQAGYESYSANAYGIEFARTPGLTIRADSGVSPNFSACEVNGKWIWADTIRALVALDTDVEDADQGNGIYHEGWIVLTNTAPQQTTATFINTHFTLQTTTNDTLFALKSAQGVYPGAGLMVINPDFDGLTTAGKARLFRIYDGNNGGVIAAKPQFISPLVSGGALAAGQFNGLLNTEYRTATTTNYWMLAPGAQPGVWMGYGAAAARVQDGNKEGALYIGANTGTNYVSANASKFGGINFFGYPDSVGATGARFGGISAYSPAADSRTLRLGFTSANIHTANEIDFYTASGTTTGSNAPAMMIDPTKTVIIPGTNSAGEIIGTGGITLGGVRRTSWPSGTVTSVASTVPGSLLTLSGSPITTSGTLAYDLATQSANKFFLGPASGSAAQPTWRSPVPLDLAPNVNSNLVLSIGAATNLIWTNRLDLDTLDVTTMIVGALQVPFASAVVYADATSNLVAATSSNVRSALGITGTPSGSKFLRDDWSWQPVAGAGTVTSVDATGPSGLLSWSGGPITSSGTLTASLANQNANKIFAGPSSGSAAAPTFRSVVHADLAPYQQSNSVLVATGNTNGAPAWTNDLNVNSVTAPGGFTGPLTGNVTGNASGTAGGLASGTYNYGSSPVIVNGNAANYANGLQSGAHGTNNLFMGDGNGNVNGTNAVRIGTAVTATVSNAVQKVEIATGAGVGIQITSGGSTPDITTTNGSGWSQLQNDNWSISGTYTGSGFSGNGSGLTSVTAANLAAGTVVNPVNLVQTTNLLLSNIVSPTNFIASTTIDMSGNAETYSNMAANVTYAGFSNVNPTNFNSKLIHFFNNSGSDKAATPPAGVITNWVANYCTNNRTADLLITIKPGVFTNWDWLTR